MARRTVEDTQRTRDAILERAVAVASTDGLEGLTIGRLATDVGMSKSGLIRHFGSKEELQLAAVAGAVATFTAEVWEPVATEAPGLPRLRAALRAWVSYLERRVFPGGCFLSAASLEFDDRPGPVRDAVAAAMRRWLRVLETEAATARDDGALPAGTDARQLAFELNGVLVGANLVHRLGLDPDALARAHRATERLLVAPPIAG